MTVVWVVGILVLLLLTQPRRPGYRPTLPPKNPIPPSERPVIPPSDGTGDNSVTRYM